MYWFFDSLQLFVVTAKIGEHAEYIVAFGAEIRFRLPATERIHLS